MKLLRTSHGALVSPAGGGAGRLNAGPLGENQDAGPIEQGVDILGRKGKIPKPTRKMAPAITGTGAIRLWCLKRVMRFVSGTFTGQWQKSQPKPA